MLEQRSCYTGTTDTPRSDLPREPEPFESELTFILSEASRVLSRPVRRADPLRCSMPTVSC